MDTGAEGERIGYGRRGAANQSRLRLTDGKALQRRGLAFMGAKIRCGCRQSSGRPDCGT